MIESSRRRPAIAISVLIGLVLMLGAGSAQAVVVYNNLADANVGSVSITTAPQFLGNKISVGASAVTITTITAKMNLRTAGAGLEMKICDDNGAGTAPSATCSLFTTVMAIGATADYVFTGSYAAPANATIWVTMSTVGPGTFRSFVTNASSRLYVFNGVTWTADTFSSLIKLEGDLPVASVPTLSQWSVIALTAMVFLLGLMKTRRQRISA
jgi:hypothetical protein